MMSLVSCAPSPTKSDNYRFAAGSGRLVLDIDGLRNSTGEVFVSIFFGGKGFPADVEAAVVNLQLPIVAGQCRFTIDDLPYGAYAATVLHDEDIDGQMKKSLLGIPQEGFGFSGNPKAKMGPPKYDDARFLLLVPEKRMTILMQYETVGRERQRIMQERKESGADG